MKKISQFTLSRKVLATFIAILICSKMVQAQTLSITLTPSNYNGYNIPCFGGQNGSITATVTGGTPPYTYEWSNGEVTQTINDLPAGYWHVYVTLIQTMENLQLK